MMRAVDHFGTATKAKRMPDSHSGSEALRLLASSFRRQHETGANLHVFPICLNQLAVPG